MVTIHLSLPRVPLATGGVHHIAWSQVASLRTGASLALAAGGVAVALGAGATPATVGTSVSPSLRVTSSAPAGAGTLVPGRALARCSTLAYSGTGAAALSLYRGSYTASPARGALVRLTVQVGPPTPGADCQGFRAASTVYSGPVAALPLVPTAATTLAVRGPLALRVRCTYLMAATAAHAARSGHLAVALAWQVSAVPER